MTVLNLQPPQSGPTAEQSPRWWAPEDDADWMWVLAAPFRAHVQDLIAAHALPWRALAGYAGVPDNVVRSLLGRPGRAPVRRIAPHYARAIMGIDHRLLGQDLAAAVPDLWASAAAQVLRDAGWPDERIGRVSELPAGSVYALLTGRPLRVTRRNELLLLAALRAHGLDLEVPGATWAA